MAPRTWPTRSGHGSSLIHGEVSEALEALRKDDHPNFAEELADVVIRVADLAGGSGVDLEGEITRKMVDAALGEPGTVLEARFEGIGRDGGPACATVPLLDGGWRLVRGGG